MYKRNGSTRKMKKKVGVTVTVIILFVILMFPTVYQIKDGGSVEYRAVFYQVTKWHRYEGMLDSDKSRPIYYDGTEVKVFGITVYNNAENMVYIYCK